MIRLLQWWKVVATLSWLSAGARSYNSNNKYDNMYNSNMYKIYENIGDIDLHFIGDSINLNFENYEDIDLGFLGTPNLDQYDANVEFSIEERKGEKGKDDECIYTIHVDFDINSHETPPGDGDYKGGCMPNGNQGNATDGKPWHARRTHWIRLPERVREITGLDHMAMEWVPCGRPPAGFRQAFWEIAFYTVIPEYRAFMICDTFKTPSVCQYNQTTHLGRRMFTMARLAQDPKYLANLPLDFGPDPVHPVAHEYEGLYHYNPRLIPNVTENWTLPDFLMTTYDAATISWRAMIPHRFYRGKYWSRSSQYQYYVYQTMMGLPSNWSTYFDSKRMFVDVDGFVLESARGVCGKALDPVVGKKEKTDVKLVFEDTKTKPPPEPSDMN